jgi:tRNA (cytidine32/uridine32-2'-O)-methyltransferase
VLANLRIVLVETSHPGNIGAAARAMKNMGLSQLYLVNPKQFPHQEATARAAGADDLLQHAVICSTLDEAINDCELVLATSARQRHLAWPTCDPRECAALVHQATDKKIAIMFGNERAGLSNEQLCQSHYHVHIPVEESFSSLNLAAAVQVISYELRMAASTLQPKIVAESEPMANHQDMNAYYQRLQSTLVELEFCDPKQPRLLMQRLQRLYNRARLSKTEVNILQGILSAVAKNTKTN